MSGQPVALTLLGSSGGLAKAVLAILNRSVQDAADPIHSIIQHSTLHLIDIKQKDPAYYADLYPHLFSRLSLHQLDLMDVEAFREHLINSGTKAVIDVSWADTLHMLGCCNEMGIAYVNTALENSEVDDDASLYGFPLAERYERFERQKDTFNNSTSVICSGMNPGIVQWMAMKLRQENPQVNPLACYIIEHDNSFYSDQSVVQPETVYTSWSVECFLDEAIHSYPMFVRHRIPLYLYEDVYSAEYRVSLGDKTFYGCLMPHEEVMTMGKMWDCEIGFIYRVSEATTEVIRAHLDDTDVLWDWKQQIIEPSVSDVEGQDLVGVLMVYENEEKYMYNTLSSRDIFPKYRTNATYFQVACGVYAALSSILLDPLPKGAHYVEELLQTGKSKYENYLTYYMKDFVRGTNPRSDGLLHQRRREA
ncbi:S-adenosylmethionine decarboxylase related protein [Cohnella kolymensis]|uniref:S-adenosylmethionine decarboxylase related protein n=2 Tax=Cohnella kolymensis TaxID=1590652 RepID=A0ABR5A878_9BACL|nr:S-adenosylmethionine decarboxylase related protein [Cohnella kolymensis]